MMKPPLFIAMEGLDGSGESTQADLLKKYFEDRKIKVLLTKEPYIKTKFGKTIRKVLEKKIKIGLRELQDLFTKNREEHLKKLILPSLKKGITVISDRYYFSTFAFGGASGVDIEYLISKNKKFLHPDITFILDVNPKTAISRIEKRRKPKEFFEKLSRLVGTRKFYQTFSKRFKNVYIINGEKSIDEVFKQIKRRLEK